MSKQRPRVFVGSSSEGQRIAQAVQVLLDQPCEVELWSQGIFGPGQPFLESLESALKGFDFAILVLTADDLKIVRGETKPSARDNVIFELGFFVAGLGRERTYMIFDRTNPPDLPTDLAGITALTYEPHSSGNVEASLGAPCRRILTEIEWHGLRVKYGSYAVGVEAVLAIVNTGQAEPTGAMVFTQLSDENSAGYIVISYGIPITVPWQKISVIGSGGLTRARLDESRSSRFAGQISIIVPAGGRHGDTIRVSGVRVAVAGTTLTYLAASIAAEGNTIPPSQSYVHVVKSIAPAIAHVKSTEAQLDTSTVGASATGYVTIREGFIRSFVGRNQMTPGMTNGTEFRLTLSAMPPEIEFLIDDNLPAAKAVPKQPSDDPLTFQTMLMESASEVTIPYRVRTKGKVSLRSPLAITGVISLAPIGTAFSAEGQPSGVVPRYVASDVGPVTLVTLR